MGQEAIDQKTLERPEVTEAKNTKTGKKTKPLKQNQRTIQRWDEMPGELVETPSLERFKNLLDGAIDNIT